MLGCNLLYYTLRSVCYVLCGTVQAILNLLWLYNFVVYTCIPQFSLKPVCVCVHCVVYTCIVLRFVLNLFNCIQSSVHPCVLCVSSLECDCTK